MKVQKLQRSRETFIERMATKDEKTIRSYGVAINNFENFCMEKYGNADFVSELKDYETEDIFEVLQSWINWNNKLAPSSTKVMFSRIKKYLYHRGIKLYQQDINEELEFRTLIQEERYGLTLDDIQTIVKPMRYKHRTQFICQLSSLMRIGEITQLRKKHLISDKQNIIVKIPATIAKLKKARTTFFSKEASRLLKPLLREINDEDLVFGVKAETSIAQVLRRILIKTGLDMKYESSGDYMINTHSFRAYGITKLSRHDPNLAKKLAGQKGYLDQYDRINDDEKLELYQKFEIDLIIDNTVKLKADNEKLKQEKSEIHSIKKTVHTEAHFFNEQLQVQRKFNESMMEKMSEMAKELKKLKSI
jgi:integrase